MESCGFCPHRKPCCQTTYENITGGRDMFMNLGSTYDGDFGNEVVMGEVTCNGIGVKADATGTYKVEWTEGQTKKEATYHYPAAFCNGSISFTMREPVMVEPLDYYSQRSGSKTMNNITNIDLEYNFNNLRNMLQFNRGKMYQMSSNLFIPNVDFAPKSWKGITKNDTNWWVNYVTSHLEEIVEVNITNAELVFDIATPNTVSVAPFVTDYVEYKRYETINTKVDDIVACRTDRKIVGEIDSIFIISLTCLIQFTSELHQIQRKCMEAVNVLCSRTLTHKLRM